MGFSDIMSDIGDFLNNTSDDIAKLVQVGRGQPAPQVRGTGSPSLSTQGQVVKSPTNWLAIVGIGAAVILGTVLVFRVKWT